MINCEQAHNLFEAYLNDELPSGLTAELDAHRLDCAACRHHLTLMEACGNVVRLDTDEPSVSGDFGDRLMAILEEDRRGRGWLQVGRSMKVAGGLLGIAAAIALVVLFYPRADNPEGDRVAGAQSDPSTPQTSSAALITNLPLGTLFDLTDSLTSTIELGQYSINQISDALPVDQNPAMNDYSDLETLNGHQQPDVIETLPDLDDGGELM